MRLQLLTRQAAHQSLFPVFFIITFGIVKTVKLFFVIFVKILIRTVIFGVVRVLFFIAARRGVAVYFLFFGSEALKLGLPSKIIKKSVDFNYGR